MAEVPGSRAFSRVTCTTLCTTIDLGDSSVATVEHVISALSD
jgi:UDP-3-O-[3-hydroxymyristoyl] N-acetylglucosamine deacetylase